ncbi:hypothetical protein PsorP6_015233 [Peronosclerospora sorghi]|uniref:Uncharacterized protein n=1 Tax=Peronosclerospora sorghi TaxID=230839 RepID=A0ACC0VTB7_9STRA|nr:hypothetical protein PsorP6_015233 [Peronosclerospora sorghi]
MHPFVNKIFQFALDKIFDICIRIPYFQIVVVPRMKLHCHQDEENCRLKETRELPIHALCNHVQVTRKRGRPAGSKNRANTRDKPAFEYTTGNKCGNYGKNGHNSRTCRE